MSRKIGFLGIGIMGRGMVQNLLKAGFEVTVWNRSADKLTEVLAAGATAADSPKSLAESVDTILICVTNESVVEDLLFNESSGVLTAASPLKTIIDLSTISPMAAKRFATQLHEKNIDYIDAPVSGGDVGAAKGTLTIMVGGEKSAVDAQRAIFAAIGETIVYAGESGNGQKTKCINQIVVGLNITAMTEGLFLAENAGLDLQTTLDAIKGGAAGSWSLDNYAPRLIRGEKGPGFYAKDQLKDLKYVADLASEAEIELPGLDLALKLYQKLVEQDPDSTLGNHALIELYRT